MSDTSFRPTLFVKSTCPHCLKVRIFLLDAGLGDAVAVRVFSEGDAAEAPIRAELAPHFAKLTFPVLEDAAGRYVNESDAIVALLADRFGVDTASLPVFAAYAGSVLPKYQACRRELKALKEAAPA